ncbi:hypothetical protein KRZ98_18060 [Sphingobium sp. AS12]|uniref:hypothetical protein n=1 Tax=Sphingobium sp. AS12 TaxID=2849495 RepID=UPI001C31DA8F|nr:hypothetical protein [Sphingobium sp. AS12]MBV2150150.1 hypothetical protein [Sphingobium sp. AS12]
MTRLPAYPFVRFLLALLGTFIVLIMASVIVFRWQLGTMTKETLSRCVGVYSKMEAATAQSSPKILFVGGSAVHKGINTGAVGDAVSVRAANFGTFAALGPDVMLWNARKLLKPGDTAALVLEYDLFWHDKPTEPEIDYVTGCGKDYFDQLSLTRQMAYVLGSDPLRMFTTTDKTVEEKLPNARNRLTPSGDPRFTVINFKNIGDSQRERMKLYQPLTIRVDRSSRDMRAIAEFISWANEHDVRVLALWPNTLRFESYDRDPAFAQIRDFYEANGVEMVGKPSDTMVPLEELHDTQYHLNEKGIVRRTQITINLLKPYFDVKGAEGGQR